MLHFQHSDKIWSNVLKYLNPLKVKNPILLKKRLQHRYFPMMGKLALNRLTNSQHCTKNEIFHISSVNVTKSAVSYEFGHIY